MNANIHDINMAPLLRLGDDLLIEILSKLGSTDLISLRKVCHFHVSKACSKH